MMNSQAPPHRIRFILSLSLSLSLLISYVMIIIQLILILIVCASLVLLASIVFQPNPQTSAAADNEILVEIEM
jgi:hypothetical protein